MFGVSIWGIEWGVWAWVRAQGYTMAFCILLLVPSHFMLHVHALTLSPSLPYYCLSYVHALFIIPSECLYNMMTPFPFTDFYQGTLGKGNYSKSSPCVVM